MQVISKTRSPYRVGIRTKILIRILAVWLIVVRRECPCTSQRVGIALPKVKGETYWKWNALLESRLPYTPLGPRLPIHWTMIFLIRKLVLVCATSNAIAKLVPFPYDDLDELRDMLVDHQGFQVTKRVEEGVVETFQSIDGGPSPDCYRISWRIELTICPPRSQRRHGRSLKMSGEMNHAAWCAQPGTYQNETTLGLQPFCDYPDIL
jgi:hypothetical protein